MPTARSTRCGPRSRTRSSRCRRAHEIDDLASVCHSLDVCKPARWSVLGRARSLRLRPLPASFHRLVFDAHRAPSGRRPSMIIRKSKAEIEGMARAGALLYETLQLCAEALAPGTAMLELDRIAH